jgi:hypothetical protein
MTPAAISAPVVASTAPALEPLAQFNPSDLERLRNLIQATAAQTANPQGLSVTAANAAGGVTPVQGASFGDSILQGLLRFGEGYQSSMKSIEGRLQEVARADPTSLANFADIMALQIDVSKWSMSVMGVDNASKAGSNTIKELSRGG